MSKKNLQTHGKSANVKQSVGVVARANIADKTMSKQLSADAVSPLMSTIRKPLTNSIGYLENTSCCQLQGVGPQLKALLAKKGIISLQDLLFHLPIRYQDRTRVTPINTLAHGQYAVIEGMIVYVRIEQRSRRILICQLADDFGWVNIKFFHFTAAQRVYLVPGVRLHCFGEVRRGPQGLEMIHPEYRIIILNEISYVAEHLTPIYPSTEGLSQQRLRVLTAQALRKLAAHSELLIDYIPVELCNQLQLPTLAKALSTVHQPTPDIAVNLLENYQHSSQQRLVFEELLAYQLSLQRLRRVVQNHTAPPLQITDKQKQQFLTQLPFSLTRAQHRVVDEILSDLSNPQPMLRLVQGDVGCGKTIVAGIAVLVAIVNQYQAAIMAPTELLAEQHFQHFQQWFEHLGHQVVWLTGSLTSKARRLALARISCGEAQIIVGTHAIFQKEVEFSNLGLIVVDEQHRFGVQQRLALRDKNVKHNYFPHQLTMSATPIPRTLAMAAYADLDISVIDELPPGRKPIKTVVISQQRREEVIQRIHEICKKSAQVYWVCTLIEASEVLQCQAAEVANAELSEALPGLRVGLVHGRLSSSEREKIMQDFKAGLIDVLVATTVIEVGVDVPNASLMVIENPERLGLAQLHQLRGRVGRGLADSYCILLYNTPLSEQARQRLSVMRLTNDGFKIAERDLELRGPGEILGTRQTGNLHFKIANIMRDKALLPKVKQAAKMIFNNYPEHVEPLIIRWLGNKEQYRQV